MTVRVTLEMSPKLSDEVSRLANERGCTKADVWRTAIGLFLAAVQAKEEGFTVGAYRITGTLHQEQEFIFPT